MYQQFKISSIFDPIIDILQARYASTEKYVRSVYMKLTRQTEVSWKDDVWFSAVWKKKGDAKYGFQSG
jgi:hypothetical protein